MAIISYTNVILEKDGIQVTIGMLPTDEVIVSKTYTAITYPKSTTAQSRKPADPEYGANTTLVFDILSQAEKRVNIDGFIFADSGDSTNDNSSTGSGKKTDLEKMWHAGGVIIMTYEGVKFNMASDKISIKRVSNDGHINVGGQVPDFSIKFTALVGEDLIGCET